MKIEYGNRFKIDKKSFLYSIGLNQKFNIKENYYAICSWYDYVINFGNYDELVLFDKNEFHLNF